MLSSLNKDLRRYEPVLTEEKKSSEIKIQIFEYLQQMFVVYKTFLVQSEQLYSTTTL